ncbi:protein TBATA isoform X5 [Pteropus medius]|uniref:protein TBATA isoform X5 n=1 Tax=Pteropus vampyrus TaxID=132908 RepID=UPI00196A43BD|nr:protein TBATA isoform X5 [Pteropus giganteus]
MCLCSNQVFGPKAELKPEKKSGHRPRNHEDDGPQKELKVPGIVDFEVIRKELKTPKPQTSGTYRFGRLSHHSFFSRHHPHPQRVTHIQDLTGKPVCVVRDEFSLDPLLQTALSSHYLMGMPTISVPIGDPQSNQDPWLSSEAWKKELKDLASRVVVLTKENEPKNKERWSPDLRLAGPGAADLGTSMSDLANRLFECYPVLATLRSPKGERLGTRAPADGSGSASSPGSRLHPNRTTLAPAPGSPGTTSRKGTTTLQPVQEDEDTLSTKKRKTRAYRESTSSPDAFKPGHRRESIKANGRVLRRQWRLAHLAQGPAWSSGLLPPLSPQQQYVLSYHTRSIKMPSSL